MDSKGLLKSLLFVLVMCAITVLPTILVLVVVFFMRRSMSKKPFTPPDDAEQTEPDG